MIFHSDQSRHSGEINCIWLSAIVGEWLVGVSVKLSRPSQEMASDFPDMEGASSVK